MQRFSDLMATTQARNAADRASSWVEIPEQLGAASHPNQLLVLNHVCIDSQRIHFFRNATAAALFDKHKEPYRVWPGFAPARKAPPSRAFATTLHNSSWARARRSLNQSGIHVARWAEETSFLWVPHKAAAYNKFHFYNNFWLPLWLNVVLSGSEHLDKRLFLFKVWPLAPVSHVPGQVASWPHDALHASYFYIIYKLFREVAWPIENIWAGERAICFDRLVWSQQQTTVRYPYQAVCSYEQFYRKVSLIPSSILAIRRAMGVEQRGLPLAAENHGPSRKPSIVWISRQDACSAQNGRTEATGIDRCVRNLDAVLEELRRTQLFGMIRVVSDFKKHNDTSERDAQFRHQLEAVRDSDILIGVHGAGMTHIHYLEPQGAVMELLDNYYFTNRLGSNIYQSMARMQGCGYVGADIRGAANTSRGYVFSPRFTAHLASVALAAWNQTQWEPHDACCHYQPSKPVHCPRSDCKGPLNRVVALKEA